MRDSSWHLRKPTLTWAFEIARLLQARRSNLRRAFAIPFLIRPEPDGDDLFGSSVITQIAGRTVS
jgi:hypothetical protein